MNRTPRRQKAIDFNHLRCPRRELPDPFVGFALEVEVRRDEVELRPAARPRIHEPSEAPRSGTVAITTLLEEDALAVGVFDGP